VRFEQSTANKIGAHFLSNEKQMTTDDRAGIYVTEIDVFSRRFASVPLQLAKRMHILGPFWSLALLFQSATWSPQFQTALPAALLVPCQFHTIRMLTLHDELFHSDGDARIEEQQPMVSGHAQKQRQENNADKDFNCLVSIECWS
jgi:hypothetical protein